MPAPPRHPFLAPALEAAARSLDLAGPLCRCGSAQDRHRPYVEGGCLDCPCPGFALTGREELDTYRRTRADRPALVELLDGMTGERRRVRLNLAGPVLRVRRRRDPATGRLLPVWDWWLRSGCRLCAHGEAASWAAAHARGGAALDVELAGAQLLEQATGA